MQPIFAMAEEARFELADPCRSPVFKTGALNHYATPPSREFIERYQKRQVLIDYRSKFRLCYNKTVLFQPHEI